jgi:hypothetical protein
MIDQAINHSRSQLGELAVMQHRINESEKLILKRAETRLDEVNARIQEIRSLAFDQPHEYMNLIQEQGQLNMVIVQARASFR